MRTNLRLLSTLICSFLVTALAAAVPFKTTTISNGEFAKGTVWYTMQIGTNQNVISDNAGADRIKLLKVNSTLEAADLWCFVGDETKGYQIYNKQAGPGKVLASSKQMGKLAGYGGTGGSTYPTMQDVNDLPADYIGTWDLKASDQLTDVDGYFVILHGTQYAMNNFGGVGDLAFWAEGMDAGSTVSFKFAETVVEINEAKGSFTSSNATKTWHAVWSSSVLDGFSLSTGVNNMTTENGYIAAFSGTSNNCTHTLTAPEGCAIAGYSFDFKNYQNGSHSETLTIDGKTYKSSTQTQHVDVTGLKERSATYTQSGSNKGVTLSNYYVTVCRALVEAEPQVDIFVTQPGKIPYRIPAITKAFNGDLIAVADYRHSGADIGMAPYGRIDLHARISKDNGATWEAMFPIVEGQGKQSPDFMHVGFGDPCIVADRESSRVLVLSCAGNVSFPSGTNSNHQNIARFYSDDNGQKWTDPVDIAPQFYSALDKGACGPVMAMFIGSGKIVQSYTTKVGEYYRLYCAVLCKDKNANYTNWVFYSDDFGGNWNVLGGADVPPVTSGGDEPKVEELPDGSILLSSRIHGGRFYNIYNFTDTKTAAGSWGTAVSSNANNSGVVAVNNSTNGEVMCLPVTRKEDGKDMFLLLQSVPFGSGRANVGIYYKELASLEDFLNPTNIAKDWDGRHQASHIGSAYSTMTWQADNKVGFLYEEETYGAAYTIVYKNYSIEQITDSAYTYNPNVDRHAFVAEGIDVKTESLLGGGNYVGAVKADALESVKSTIEAYKAAPSKEAYEAINKAILELPTIEVEANKWYRLRNVERQNGTLYLKPEASRFTVGATNNLENADQLFSFVETEKEGQYYLYNGNYELYLGKLGANETQPEVLTTTTNAATWSIVSAPNGQSQVINNNNTGSNKGLHLAGDNQRLVPWTTTAPASLWYIEPVESFPVSVPESGYTTINLPFAVEMPADVKAYAAVKEEVIENVECLVIEEVTGAVKGAVILAAEAGNYELPLAAEATVADEAPANLLKGTLKANNLGKRVYLLNGASFKKQGTVGSIAANKAYYESETAGEELALSVSEGNDTGIESVSSEQQRVQFFSLDGRLVKNPGKGIFVTSDGKKVLVK